MLAAGILISLPVPTRVMRVEAASAGFYTTRWNENYPCRQLLKITDLLDGKGVAYPTWSANSTHKSAPRVRPQGDQEGHVNGEDWQSLTVCARNGTVLGVVVGVFAEGPLAGRLRVEGAYVPDRAARGPRDSIAVYAIPCRAVVGRQQDSLLLDVTHVTARRRWLMHVRQRNGP